MWFRQETIVQKPVNEGAFYRRSRGPHIVETAKVIAVVPDGLGIPHVRFFLQIQSPCEVAFEQRTLALQSFATLYGEQIGA